MKKHFILLSLLLSILTASSRISAQPTPFIYDFVQSFHEGFAMVMKDGKCGFIGRTGKVVIPFIYDDAISFSEGLAAVKKEGKWGFIDKSGNLLILSEEEKVQ